MSTTLRLYTSHEHAIHENTNESIKLDLPIPLSCPFCGVTGKQVSTWGYYQTLKGEVRRYKCKPCVKTFNPAKLPFLKDKLTELIWKLAQLTIEDQLTINSLSQKFFVPETTLRRLVTEIKTFLSDNFEKAKQLYEMSAIKQGTKNEGLNVIFYDEGFLKILGKTGYLIFTVDNDGKPISLAVEPHRDGETIYNHFLQSQTQLGGIDVIVSDGARTINAAVKALNQPILLIQQVHTGNAKRAKVIEYKPIPNRKAIEETTIELHTGSLLPNTESIITAKKQNVYPPKYTPYKKKQKTKKRKITTKSLTVKREGTLTPVEGANKRKSRKSRKPNLLKGHQVFLRTCNNPLENEMSFIPSEADYTAKDCPTLIKLQRMINLAQTALPDQFITSNRAEVFNAVYDRNNHSWGITTIKQANNNARAWAVLKFYPNEAKKLIKQHSWHLPYSLIRQLGFLVFSKMEIC